MTFFQYLLCNQYHDINKRGGNASKSHINTLILSTVLITLLIVTAFIFYDKVYPGFLYKNFGNWGIDGKAIGKLLGAVIGVIIFILLKLTIGKQRWYDETINQFKGMYDAEQDRVSRKGLRYFLIAAVPVIAMMLDAIFSIF